MQVTRPSGSLVFYSGFDSFSIWKNALQRCLPELEVLMPRSHRSLAHPFRAGLEAARRLFRPHEEPAPDRQSRSGRRLAGRTHRHARRRSHHADLRSPDGPHDGEVCAVRHAASCAGHSAFRAGTTQGHLGVSPPSRPGRHRGGGARPGTTRRPCGPRAAAAGPDGEGLVAVAGGHRGRRMLLGNGDPRRRPLASGHPGRDAAAHPQHPWTASRASA